MKKYFMICIFLILFGFGCQSQEQKDLQAKCVESGGEFHEGYCTCPPLFPVFDETREVCMDIYGQYATSAKEAGRLQERVDYVGLCKKKEYDAIYVIPGTPVTFCYPASWGDTKLESLGTGDVDLNRVDFYVDKKRKTGLQQVYVGQGEEFLEKESGVSFCTSCILEEDGDQKLISSVRYQGENVSDAVVSSISIGGADGKLLSLERLSKVYYISVYYPDSQYVVIGDGISQKESLDDFIQTVWFDDLAQ
ncbi:MAG: hypothetical protein ABII02_01785 [Candidatus Magasanikbacteria bacterium]